MGTTVLITGTKEGGRSSHYGTGFVIYNNKENGSFILTCRHVLEQCLGTFAWKKLIEDDTKISWKKKILVDGEYADVIVLGFDKKDLAVIYVKNLKKPVPFKLCMNSLLLGDKDIVFKAEGFDAPELKSLKDINGLIVKKVSRGLDFFRLKVNKDSSSIEGGNSGSAIVLPESNHVIGVLVAEDNDEEVGLAISIEYLKDIWKEMPIEIWVDCNYKLSFFKHKKNMFISLLKFFGIGVVVFLLFMFLRQEEELKWKPITIISSPIPISFKKLAKDAYDLGNYEKAKHYYNQAISEDSLNGQLYSDLGLTYYRLGSIYDIESLQVSKLAIEKAKGNSNIQASSYYNIGRVYERQRNYSEALNNYDEALRSYQKVLKQNEEIIQEYHKRIKSMKKKLGLDF